MSGQRKTLRAVVVSPGKKAVIDDIPASLKGMQKVVGGTLQRVWPFEDHSACLVCNDDGKIIGLPYSRMVAFEGTNYEEIVVGTFFICGVDQQTGEFASLTDEQAQFYLDKFLLPQYLFSLNLLRYIAVKSTTEFVAKETRPTISAKEVVEEFGKLQKKGSWFPCLRCGRPTMSHRLAENSLSRRAEVHVCPSCGMMEAMEDYTKNVAPIKEWAICKILEMQAEPGVDFLEE